jgi:SAM-dependent methyltransferase
MSDSELKQRYHDGKWDGEASYLAGARVLLHNSDYLEFLVSRVWKLDRPCRLVDFGCGSGRFGQMLMPLLPEGSTYTGFDQSSPLLEEGRRLFAGTRYCAEFTEGTVHDAPFPDSSFDVAVSQAVLMHIPNPMGAIREMIRVTKQGGMVITCDANRNAANALIHTDELDTQDTSPIELFQTINHEIRRRTGVDHNIGIKTPILMHKAGLKNVQARVSDCVSLVLPPVDTSYAEAVFRAICDDGYGPSVPNDEQRAEWKASMVGYGISEEDAENEIERELAIDFRGKGHSYHTAYPSLLSFSFGTVDKQ